MPYFEADEETPESLEIFLKRTNSANIVLNIAFPLLTAVAYYLTDTLQNASENQSLYVFLVTSRLGVCFLQVVSAIYLGLGINRVRK